SEPGGSDRQAGSWARASQLALMIPIRTFSVTPRPLERDAVEAEHQFVMLQRGARGNAERRDALHPCGGGQQVQFAACQVRAEAAVAGLHRTRSADSACGPTSKSSRSARRTRRRHAPRPPSTASQKPYRDYRPMVCDPDLDVVDV